MKKIILYLFLFCVLSAFSQTKEAFYGKLNYVLVPHNIVQGSGYSIGYEYNKLKPISYKVEFGMLTSHRVRETNLSYVDIRFKDLYYSLAQINMAYIPTWHFVKKDNFQCSAGLGLSGAYQSKIFTLSHYEINRNTASDYWENIMTVDASSGFHIGAVGELNVNFQISDRWSTGLSAQYQVYVKGESLLTAGISAAYRF